MSDPRGLFARDGGGTWRTINGVYVRQAGGWTSIRAVWFNTASGWRRFFTRTAVINYSLSGLNVAQIDIRTYAIALGWNQSDPLQFTITNNGHLVAPSVGSYALTLDQYGFPAFSSITIINNGVISGHGGAGGQGGSNGYATGTGGNGGPAMYLAGACYVQNNGVICGGGGGGAGGYGDDKQPGSNYIGVATVANGGGGGGGGAPFGAGGAPTAGGANYGGTADEWNPGAGGLGTVGDPARGNTAYESSPPSCCSGGSGGTYGTIGAGSGAVYSGSYSYIPSEATESGGGGQSVTVDYYYDDTTAGGPPGPAIVGGAGVTWLATGTILGA